MSSARRTAAHPAVSQHVHVIAAVRAGSRRNQARYTALEDGPELVDRDGDATYLWVSTPMMTRRCAGICCMLISACANQTRDRARDAGRSGGRDCDETCGDQDPMEVTLINAALDIHHGDPPFGYRFSPAAPNLLRLTGITEHLNGEATLPLRGQGRALHQDRGPLHRLTHETRTRGGGVAQRDRPAQPGRHDHALRSGSQVRSTAYLRTIMNNGLLGSMGRVGACGDGAARESSFALLQEHVLDRQRWAGSENQATRRLRSTSSPQRKPGGSPVRPST